MVKNLPTMRETWVRSLGWVDHMEKGKATSSSILAKSQTGLSDFHFHAKALVGLTQVALMVQNPPASAGDTREEGLIPESGRFLEEGTATHSSILA